MTREKSVIVLQNCASMLHDGTRFLKPEHVQQFREAYEMAIEALKQPEPCEDAVSRADCLQALSHLMDIDGFRDGYAVSRANVECMIKAMPSVTPERKTGKWIRVSPMTDTLMCSECGYNILGEEFKSNFCPDCGSYNGGDDNGNE